VAASGRETEIKLRIGSAGEARKRIEAAGFEIFRPRVFEANLLLDTPSASLQTAGETLRVRERGGETILTYKGPVELDRHKSREEIETSAGEAPALLAILARLGFTPTYRYEKFRTEYVRPGEAGIVTVDETPIGCFLEIEGEGDWIDSTAARLGFSENDYVNDSYAAIFRRYCSENEIEIGAGMVFGEHPSENLRVPDKV
jgi:adenylate cyclase class 2